MIEFFVFPKKLLIFPDNSFLWHHLFSDQLASKHVVGLVDARTTLSFLIQLVVFFICLSVIELFVCPKKLLTFHDNNFIEDFLFSDQLASKDIDGFMDALKTLRVFNCSSCIFHLSVYG